MFEEVIKTEINGITIAIFQNTEIKVSIRSKNYVVTHYYVYPEDETLMNLNKLTAIQAFRKFLKMSNATIKGVKHEIKQHY